MTPNPAVVLSPLLDLPYKNGFVSVSVLAIWQLMEIKQIDILFWHRDNRIREASLS